ncbi:MAG: hypothetical protein EXS51_04085 [Candidatus Taylorbacteria bacterium]|nr:hypothetical protein [Candidatus Taylorbacteria bacterium]
MNDRDFGALTVVVLRIALTLKQKTDDGKQFLPFGEYAAAEIRQLASATKLEGEKLVSWLPVALNLESEDRTLQQATTILHYCPEDKMGHELTVLTKLVLAHLSEDRPCPFMKGELQANLFIFADMYRPTTAFEAQEYSEKFIAEYTEAPVPA